MPRLARTLKVGAVTDTLHSERDRLCRAITAATGHPHPQLGEAVAELLSHIGVYRSDYPSLASVLSIALAETAVARPDLAEPLSVVSVAVGAGGEAAVRLQQLCGAATAKSMEDCLFYRDPRLVSLNEVGGEPDRFGVSLAEFHQRAAVRAALWPHAMTALSTHDTKRGEDVRARIGVLSQVPSLWAQFVTAWEQRAPFTRPDDRTVPVAEHLRRLAGRRRGHRRLARPPARAMPRRRSGKQASTPRGTNPDAAFEHNVHTWIDAIIDGPIATELTTTVARLDEYASSDSLGQKLIQLTAPGVPDVYQGTELWDDSLVDPDNRRPVDFTVQT